MATTPTNDPVHVTTPPADRGGLPAPSANSVLGVPFLPPVPVSSATARLRQRLGRIHRSMAPPPVQLLESALSMLEHRVLVALCEAGVMDGVTEPIGVAQLARRLQVDEQRLERLLRFGVTRGWFRIDRRGRVVPNRVTKFLRSDHPSGWRAWVDFVSIPGVVDAVAALDLTSDGSPFVRVNGRPFFEWMAAHPPEWSTFDRAMAAGGRMHALTLDSVLRWKSTGSVCDVGGGTGDLVTTLLDRHPGWCGVVFDLKEVVDRGVEHERLERIAGDAFVSVPNGFDTYLLVNVLHDWNDADSVRIMSNVAAAMDADARLFVVDSERRTVPRDEIFVSTDVLMAALTDGGQERTRAAFASLGSESGLHLARTHRLASGDVAHEFRRTVAAGA